MHQQPDHPVAKVCGADVELGNFILFDDRVQRTGSVAAQILLSHVAGIPHAAQANTFSDNVQDWGRKFLAANGGCVYIDLDHLELCIPEVQSAYDFVAAFHAMLVLARQAMDAANAHAPKGARLQVLVNNSDGLGNSYGSHLNFLLARRTWENIFHRKPHYLAYLASYQVSSIVVTGQGKVGAENGAPAVDYQLSQRTDFDMTVTGVQTTYDRPLVNARDEPLCGTGWSQTSRGRSKTGLARLHCIFYDSNLCHVANLLKCGMMQIVLAMLEAEWINPVLILEDPLETAVRFSHDPMLRARTRMASGKRWTAVELQRRFLDEARRFHAQGGCEGVVPRAGEILDLQADTLEKLHAGDLDAVAGRLDWVLKLQILRRVMAGRKNLNWQSPEIKHLDHLYSSLDTDGLYWTCDQAGSIEHVVTPGDIERLLHQPPEDTRAYTRAMLLRLAGRERISRVDWDSIGFKLPGRRGWPRYRWLNLPDPLGLTKAETSHLFDGDKTLNDVLDALTETDSAAHGDEDVSTASAEQPCEAAALMLPAPQAATASATHVSQTHVATCQQPQQEGEPDDETS